jgi:hypothetical protein
MKCGSNGSSVVLKNETKVAAPTTTMAQAVIQEQLDGKVVTILLM